jgi:small subunit ribosomal protein S1
MTVQAGDIVDVLLERTEDREGYVVLSRRKSEKMKIWDEVEKAYAERKVVIDRVNRAHQGGLRRYRRPRFCRVPDRRASGAESRHPARQELRMRVIKINKKRGNIVLAQSALEERTPRKEAHARGAGGRQSSQGRRKEHHRLRGVHRPGASTVVAHHRHVLGPRRPPSGYSR